MATPASVAAGLVARWRASHPLLSFDLLSPGRTRSALPPLLWTLLLAALVLLLAAGLVSPVLPAQAQGAAMAPPGRTHLPQRAAAGDDGPAAPGDYYSWIFAGYVLGNARVDYSSNPLSGATVAVYGSMDANSLGTLLNSGVTLADGYFYYTAGSYTNYPYQNLVETDPSGFVSFDAQGGTGTNCTLTKKSNNWLQNNTSAGNADCGTSYFWDVTPTATPTRTATGTPTRTATPTPTPCPYEQPWVSNVSLNGGGATVTVAPSANVTLDFDYRIYNPPSSGALREIVVGLDATAIYCAYYGVPPSCPGTTGHSTRVIQAPAAPGTYYIRQDWRWDISCANAMSYYSIGSSSILATIIVSGGSPSATSTATPSNTAVSTPTRTNTPTSTATRTNTPVFTQTQVSTATRTNTPVFTYTATRTATRTNTPVFTHTPTRTATRTNTPVLTYTPTRTATRTDTPIFTQTGTASPTFTATVTPTPSFPATVTPTATPTFAATVTPTPTTAPSATPHGRSSRTVGLIVITANSFTDIGGGQTRATGDVVFNDIFYLAGSGDQATFTSSTLTGNGQLVMTQGQTALFTGAFTAAPATGILTPGSVSYNLNRIAGFNTSGAPTISQVNLVSGAVNGTATLNISFAGVSGTATVTFTLTPGPVFSGAFNTLNLNVSGVTLSQPVGGALTSTSLTATGVTLTGAAQFGGRTVNVSAALTITPTGVTLGSGGARVVFPELWFAGSNVLTITGVQALLRSDAGGAYWDLNGTLNLTIPDNTTTAALTGVIMRGGALQGNAGNMTLNIASFTLQLNSLALSNNGLTPGSATLTMPAGLGTGSVTVNVTITGGGLQFSGAVTIPDIVFSASASPGLQTGGPILASLMPRPATTTGPLALRNNRATLTIQGTTYVFTISSNVEINLPGNAQTTTATFSIGKSGSSYQLSGSLSSLNLTLAGSTLALQNLTLSNAGFNVAAATLTLPASLGGVSGTINNVSIGRNGLSIGGGSITLPVINIGDGSKLKIINATAGIQTQSGGYAFTVSGTLQLRLPSNSQDIAVSFTINTQGQISGTISQVSLTLASTTLRLTNVSFNNSGLSVAQASLTLPSAMGGATGFVNNVTITKDGLRVGGGGVSFPFPNFTLGSAATGFSVTDVMATIEIANDGSYKISLSGTVSLQIPGASASATGTIGVNSQGQFSGSLSGFSLTVAGLNLEISNAAIASNGAITVGSATLRTPAGFGGFSISVYNVTISKSGGVSIGGGAFNLPKIQAGGFEISASGSIVRVYNPNGYEITASGTLKMAQIGAAAGCSGISVSVTLFASASGSTILLIRPEGETIPQAEVDALRNPLAVAPGEWQTEERLSGGAAASLAAVRVPAEKTEALPEPAGEPGLPVAMPPTDLRGVPDPQDFIEDPAGTPELSALKLRNASLSLTCSIPIGNTGLFLTNIRGSVTLAEGTTTVSVGLTVEAGKRILNVPVVSFNADATLTTNPFKLVIDGTVKVFIFTVAGGHAEVDAQGFSATLYINLFIARGSISVSAWSSNGFHLAGSASLTIGWLKGDIWTECIPWLCCPNGSIYNGFNCWPWKTHSCDGTCIYIPPSNMELASAGVDVGEFTNGKWGFKGWAGMTFLGIEYRIGFYIDTTGKIVLGNVGAYRLVSRSAVLQAMRQWQLARERGETVSDSWSTPEGDFVFLPDGDVLISAPVTRTTDVAFSMARNAAAPELSLISPSGLTITPGALPANISFQRISTYTYAIRPEVPDDVAGAISDKAIAALQSAAIGSDTVASLCDFRAAAAMMASDKTLLQAATQDAAAQAALRVTHAWPETGPVDILVDGAPVLTNLAYGATSAYVPLTPGVHTIQAVAAGAGGPALAQTTLTAAVGSANTLVGNGRATSMAFLSLLDETSFTAPGRVMFRLINAGNAAVDLYVNGGRGDLRRTGEAPYVINIASGTASGYEDLAAGTYDIEVRQTGTETVLQSISGVALNESTIYSIYVTGLKDGAPGLQLSVHTDAVPKTQMRFVHAMPGTGAVDVLLGDTVVLSNVASLSTTGYLSLDATSYTAKVVATGTAGPALATLAVDLASGADYTLAAVGTPAVRQLRLLADDRTVPEWGQARVRFVHLSPNAPAADLALVGNPDLFTNVAYLGASAYKGVAPGVYTVNVHRAGTTTPLASTSVTLAEGEAQTIFLLGLSGGTPALQALPSLDMTGQRSEQEIYFVNQAEVGVWQMKLSGDPGPLDTYVVSAIGANPAPGVSDVTATMTGGNVASVGWRITSDEPQTLVSVYANPGAITATQEITTTGGTAETVVVDVFAGELLRTNIGTPLDGTAHQIAVSTAALPSGSYHIWVEADDGHNAPVRVYAPAPIVVAQGGSWSNTWTTPITLTASYGAINAAWGSHSHPDVDGYVLYLGETPLSMTTAITVGNNTQWVAASLNPGQTYHVAVVAYDEQSGRASRSQTASGAAGAADFTATVAPASPSVIGGAQGLVTVTVSSALSPYPDSVGLHPTVSFDGISLLPATTVVTPTVGGVAVPVVISTTNTVPGGTYATPLALVGGGITRTVMVSITVMQPGFDLAVAPAAAVLGKGATAQVAITSSAIYSDNRRISLSVQDVPPGLQWALSAPGIDPGQETTLVLTDTELLAPGVYTLTVQGENGARTLDRSLVLAVQKPAFAIVALPELVLMQPGDARTLMVDVRGLYGWSGPVTLTVDTATVPDGASIGFLAGGELQNSIVVATAQRASLRISSTAALPRSRFTVQVTGESGGKQAALAFEILADVQSIYLPVIIRN